MPIVGLANFWSATDQKHDQNHVYVLTWNSLCFTTLGLLQNYGRMNRMRQMFCMESFDSTSLKWLYLLPLESNLLGMLPIEQTGVILKWLYLLSLHLILDAIEWSHSKITSCHLSHLLKWQKLFYFIGMLRNSFADRCNCWILAFSLKKWKMIDLMNWDQKNSLAKKMKKNFFKKGGYYAFFSLPIN